MVQKNDKTPLSAKRRHDEEATLPRGLVIKLATGVRGFFNRRAESSDRAHSHRVVERSAKRFECRGVHPSLASTITVKIKVYGTSVQYKSAAFPVKFDAEASVADDRTAVAKGDRYIRRSKRPPTSFARHRGDDKLQVDDGRKGTRKIK